MTPRSVGGPNATRDFAKQVAEHERHSNGQPPAKKFKSSAAPKGTKLAAGYSDRTSARRTGEANELQRDDQEKRLKALEEMYKLQQIDEATFEKLKSEIGIGGNLGTTHLVKGLDWTLLEKVRRGEDLNATPSEHDKVDENDMIDVDEELDHALEKDVASKTISSSNESVNVRSEENHTPQATTRDEILRRLKESRLGRTASNRVLEPSLGDKFKKVGSETKSNKKKFIENINGRRREVLVITNKDGSTKRKTRWLDKEENTTLKDSKPLGMEVPAEFLAKQRALLQKEAAEDEDDDIFGGVAEYDPLAGLNGESDESDGDEGDPTKVNANTKPKEATRDQGPRNYFDTQKESENGQDRANPITKDPTLLAALKRAAALRREENTGTDGVDGPGDLDPDREAKRNQFLARLKEQDRADAADMDLGFGESRFGDEDDEDGEIWASEDGEAKRPVRKRGGKKRKGDKDNVNDVMSVLEGRTKKA